MKPTLGTCYYPEHWPEDMWTDDAREMRALGIDWVRIGEFAWSRIEPKEGQFEWNWLDRAIEVLAKEGRKIVLGTPTATPPRWIIDKHPDMLAVDQNGRPRKFGSRRHYCFLHQGYRAECARIVTILAQRYGSHPAILAWQTDNEYGCHDTILSYSVAAKYEFQYWLAQKYQSPDALNRAWGNVFWSMEYNEFDEIELPNLTVTEPNPSHVMDFRRFSSDQVISFNRLQTDILRQHTDAPLVHNYMGRTTDFDHFEMGHDLDIASFDSYPIGFLEMVAGAPDDRKAEYLKQGDPDFQAFHHDLYRAVGNDRYWIMEQQPGPVNWAHYNPSPLEGMVRLWSIEAIAHGAEAVNYFRWRQAPFAQEQMHAGLKRPDNKAAQGLIEAKQVKADLNAIGDIEQVRAPVALIFDYPSQWAWEVQPQGADFDYFALLFETYRQLRKMGVDVDIISSVDGALEGYKLVIVPGLFTLTKELEQRFMQFDGQVLIGPRANSKTPDFHIPKSLPPSLRHMDITVLRVETLRPGTRVDLENGGAAISWIEDIETSEEIVEKTTDGRIIACSKANWTYLGAQLNDLALARILQNQLDKAGVPIQKLPRGVRIRHTKDHVFLFNYTSVEQEYDGHILPPAGVHYVKL